MTDIMGFFLLSFDYTQIYMFHLKFHPAISNQLMSRRIEEEENGTIV